MTKAATLLLGLTALSLNACTPEASPKKNDGKAPPSGSSAPQAAPAPQSTSASPLAQADIKAVPLVDGDSIWSGKVGQAEIVVELRIRDGDVGGRYYYKKHGRSLILSGTKKGARVTLQEQGGGADKVFGPALASFSLKSNKNQLMGEWKSLAGEKKALSVVLHREPKADYDELRLVRRAPAVPSKDGSFKTRSSSFIHEHLVYCKTEAPPPVDLKLIPGLTVLGDECHFAFEGKEGKRIIIEGKRVSIVEAKDGLKWEAVNQNLEPPMPYGPGETWEGSYSVQLVEAEGRFLTVEYATSGLGIGAYPDHDHFGRTFDLSTGEAVTWRDLLEDPGSPEFRSALLKRQKKTLTQSEDCDWAQIWSPDDEEPPLYPHLDAKGLLVTPAFPHVSKACQYEAFGTRVPQSLAKKYAKKGSLLSEILSDN